MALGWYYYLYENIDFPFPALWISRPRNAPEKKRPIEVLRMSDADACESDMFVEVAYDGDEFEARLSDIEAPEATEQTRRAIADWHYWCDRGYGFD